jgi:hypothetical protein
MGHGAGCRRARPAPGEAGQPGEWSIHSTGGGVRGQKNNPLSLVHQSLLDLHKLASARQDPHLTSHLEDEFLKEQAESIFKLTQYVTNLQRVGEGLGVFIFDKELQ